MVIDFAIYCQHLTAIRLKQWLLTRLWIYDAQSLVSKDSRAFAADTAPVWTAMTNLLTHSQSLLSKLLSLLFDVKDRYYSTHGCKV